LPSIPTEVRQKYAEFYKQNGIEAIRTKVREIDPVYYQTVDRNNPNRMLKALEVFDITGKPYSSFLNYSTKERSFAILKIMLDVERTALYNRINNRVDQMVKSGLEAEARQLIPFRHVNPLKTVGYKEFFDYFEGKISYDEAVTQIKNHSRAYARRQLTWFRRYTEAQWFSPDDTKEMYNLILNTLN
jgi:tRNA dimethylallyltransferase